MAFEIIIPQSPVLDSTGRMAREWWLFFINAAEAIAAAGSGTVTATGGNLTQQAIILGNGGKDIRPGPLPVSAGFVLTDNGPGADPSFQPGGLTNPMTTAGDIIVGGIAGTPARLGKGADGTILTMAAGAESWAFPVAGGITLGQVVAQDILPILL